MVLAFSYFIVRAFLSYWFALCYLCRYNLKNIILIGKEPIRVIVFRKEIWWEVLVLKKQLADSNNIVKHTQKQVKELEDKTDYSRLDSMVDEDIDYTDTPETDNTLWAKAEIKTPRS